MTTKPFNLIREKWLPVVRRNGDKETIAPSGVVDGIRGDNPVTAFDWHRPDFNGASLEFMIGLLSTAAAPASEHDPIWDDWWNTPPDAAVLDERFGTVVHAFDLDGDGARFMQDRDPLADGKAESVSWLLLDSPGEQTLKHNRDLFVKRDDVPDSMSMADAAMALFTLMSYAPGKGRGHRTSLRGGGPLTSLLIADHGELGGTLWSRLWLNVTMRGNEPFDDKATFPWLADTRTSERGSKTEITAQEHVHPLHVHWAVPIRIRLAFDDGRAVGLRLAQYGANYLSSAFRHPLSPYYKGSKDEGLPVHPKRRIGYRDWVGLLVDDAENGREPAAVVGRSKNALEDKNAKDKPRLLAFGYVTKKAEVDSWVEGEVPVWSVKPEIKGSLESFIRKSVNAAEYVGLMLAGAVKDAKGSGYGCETDTVKEMFHADTEADLLGLVNRAAEGENTDGLGGEWVVAMRGAAVGVFDDVAPFNAMSLRSGQRARARFNLDMRLRGWQKKGKHLFGLMGVPEPVSKKVRKAA